MLTAIKALHTAIYALMVAAILYVLYCGVSGTMNVLLAVSIGLVQVPRYLAWGHRIGPLASVHRPSKIFSGPLEIREQNRLVDSYFIQLIL
jgi:hypothetical protein